MQNNQACNQTLLAPGGKKRTTTSRIKNMSGEGKKEYHNCRTHNTWGQGHGKGKPQAVGKASINTVERATRDIMTEHTQKIGYTKASKWMFQR